MTRMKVRDSDLRQEIHSRGAVPGTDLYRLLRELQVRRDADRGWEPRADRGNGADRRAGGAAEAAGQ